MSELRLDDFDVPGHALRVSLGMDFKSDDAGGESSSTARAAKGNKGKKLDVRLFLRFSEKEPLAELTRVLEALENGENKLYTVTNELANLAGMRQGRVSGGLRIEPQEGLMRWAVSFSLQEHNSVPERAESRAEKPAETTQTNKGTEITPKNNETANPFGDSWAAKQVFNALEQALKRAVDTLAD